MFHIISITFIQWKTKTKTHWIQKTCNSHTHTCIHSNKVAHIQYTTAHITHSMEKYLLLAVYVCRYIVILKTKSLNENPLHNAIKLFLLLPLYSFARIRWVLFKIDVCVFSIIYNVVAFGIEHYIAYWIFFSNLISF